MSGGSHPGERRLDGDADRAGRRPSPSAGVASAGQASAFPSIAEYAFLSDSKAMALVAPGGDVEWMCLPRPDSPSVFGALLDRDAGSFRVGPADVVVPAGRRSCPGRWCSRRRGWRERAGSSSRTRSSSAAGITTTSARRTHRRAPSDYDAAHVLVRTVRCVHGSVEVQVECEPVFDYGRTPASWSFDGPGYGSAVATAPDSETALRLAPTSPWALKEAEHARV